MNQSESLKACQIASIEEAARAFATHQRLTRREAEVFVQVCRGLKNDAIAAVLKRKPSTVRFHLYNIHRKTATSDKVELVLMAWNWSLRTLSAGQSGSGPDSALGRTG